MIIYEDSIEKWLDRQYSEVFCELGGCDDPDCDMCPWYNDNEFDTVRWIRDHDYN
jgi:hypothetical protein